MASEVEICNRALQIIGAKRITSLTEDSVNARACNAAYAVLRDAELEAHPWNFAIERAELAADAVPPAWGRVNSFTLPALFLRLLPAYPEQNINDLDYQIEQRKILTNDSAPLYIRYIYQVTDPNQMPPLFREALSARMAMELAEELSQSPSKTAMAAEMHKEKIREARRVNAIQNVAAQPPEDTYITVRN